MSSNANAADLTAFIASTGSGKTLLVRELLRATSSPVPLIWSAKEQLDRYADEFGELVDRDPARLVALARDGAAVVYVPTRDDDELLALEFDLFCRLAFALGRRRVLVEEMSLVATSRTAPASWRNLVTEGRGRGLALMATTQRPQLCDASLLDGATVIYCGRLNRGSSKKIMADAMDLPIERVRGLQPLQFLRWRAGVDQVDEVLAPVPRKKRRAR